MRTSKLGKKKGSKEFLDMYDDNICQNQMKLRNLDKVKNEHSKSVQNLMVLYAYLFNRMRLAIWRTSTIR